MEETITMSAAEITILTFSLSAIAIIISTQRIPISIASLFFLILASIFPLYSAPWEKDRDELGRVEVLAKILESKENYNLFLVEDFESNRPWKIYRGNSFLNQTSFVSKTPSGKAWIRELEIQNSRIEDSGRFSFMVHSYTEIPGRDSIEIRPQEPIYLPQGIPVRLFLWMYSEDVAMSGKLILGQEKSKDLFIDMGSIKFEGWRRLEIPLHIPAKNIRLVQSLQIPIKVKGFRFQSQPFQEQGAYFFYMDQMSILLDTSNSIYPGSEIKDNWGD